MSHADRNPDARMRKTLKAVKPYSGSPLSRNKRG